VGTLPLYQGKVLLCRRGIEPKKGLWTIPGGFMENGESTQEGAIRESVEEAHIDVKIIQAFSAISLPQFDQVHLFYLAQMQSANFKTTIESTEIQLVELKDIPWDEIAFKTVTATLRYLVEHQQAIENSQPVALLEKTIRLGL